MSLCRRLSSQLCCSLLISIVYTQMRYQNSSSVSIQVLVQNLGRFTYSATVLNPPCDSASCHLIRWDSPDCRLSIFCIVQPFEYCIRVWYALMSSNDNIHCKNETRWIHFRQDRNWNCQNRVTVVNQTWMTWMVELKIEFGLKTENHLNVQLYGQNGHLRGAIAHCIARNWTLHFRSFILFAHRWQPHRGCELRIAIYLNRSWVWLSMFLLRLS